MPTLYYAKGTIALAALIALNESGIEHDVRLVDTANSEQRTPEYLAVNPKGRLPALKTDRGILTETPAILFYLAQLVPEMKLAPLDDPFALAELQAFNSYLCSTVHVAHAHKMRGFRWADQQSSYEDMRSRVAGNMRECCKLIEDEYFKGPWVMGDTFTIADAYLFTIEGWLEGDGVNMAEFPLINDHFKRMNERKSVQEALAVA